MERASKNFQETDMRIKKKKIYQPLKQCQVREFSIKWNGMKGCTMILLKVLIFHSPQALNDNDKSPIQDFPFIYCPLNKSWQVFLVCWKNEQIYRILWFSNWIFIIHWMRLEWFRFSLILWLRLARFRNLFDYNVVMWVAYVFRVNWIVLWVLLAFRGRKSARVLLVAYIWKTKTICIAGCITNDSCNSDCINSTKKWFQISSFICLLIANDPWIVVCIFQRRLENCYVNCINSSWKWLMCFKLHNFKLKNYPCISGCINPT